MNTRCGHCGATLNIPDYFAGQAGTCNFCGGAIVVPHLQPAPPPMPTRKLDARAIWNVDPAALETIDIDPDKPMPKPVLLEFEAPSRTPQQQAAVNLFTQLIGCAVMLLIVFVGLPAGYVWYKMNTPEAKARQVEREKKRADEVKFGSAWDAEAAAYAHVMARLEYPGSADFLPGSRVVNFMGGWKVKGYLDASNRYGVPVRHIYTVTMDYDARTKAFKLKTIDLRPIR